MTKISFTVNDKIEMRIDSDVMLDLTLLRHMEQLSSKGVVWKLVPTTDDAGRDLSFAFVEV